MLRTSRFALSAALITALVAAAAFAGIAVADNASEASAAKTKSSFSKKQQKEIAKLIKAAIKKKVGPVGPQGIQGPAVAPAAYDFSNAAATGFLTDDLGTFTTLFTKTLPAGKYALNGHVAGQFVADATDKKFSFRCQTVVGTNTVDDQYAFGVSTPVFISTVGEVSISVNETLNLTAPTDVKVRCSGAHASVGAGYGVHVTANEASFNAVGVGSIG
jgi:hypothetical protein